jgi:hypothetical protein
VRIPSGQVRISFSRDTFSQGIEDGDISIRSFDTINDIRSIPLSPILIVLPLNVRDVFKVAIEDLIGQRSFKSERHFVLLKKKEKESEPEGLKKIFLLEILSHRL